MRLDIEKVFNGWIVTGSGVRTVIKDPVELLETVARKSGIIPINGNLVECLQEMSLEE